MHPLQALNETELGALVRVADRLLTTKYTYNSGNRPSRLRAGHGIEFFEHKEFSTGDDIRDIDWRASARSRKPLIRRYCDEGTANWVITLDSSSSMYIGNAEKWQLALQCTAAIAYLLLHQGNRVSVLVFNHSIQNKIPLGQGYSHYSRILHCLSKITVQARGAGSRLSYCLSHIKTHSSIFVISDLFTENNILDELGLLATIADSMHVMQISAERDYLLPEQNKARLEDIETGAVLQSNLSQTERNGFYEGLQTYNKTIARYCVKKHIQHSFHMATESWKPSVAHHLQCGKSQP